MRVFPLLAALWFAGIQPVAADALNGFDLSDALIPRNEIHHGGPPRDGIPAIDAPRFVAVTEVDYLRDDDIVLGVLHEGEARAYPTRILIWHEIVNDVIGGRPIAVTFCPLCGTGMAFDRRIGGRVLDFGVSGLLYNSDVLMYDRQSESLWSQLGLQAVSGAAKGTPLRWLPIEHMAFAAWRKKFPDSRVLSTQTGFRRDYTSEPYADYFASDEPMFPVAWNRIDLPNRALVLGVLSGGHAYAFPLDALPAGEPVVQTVGDRVLEVRYDPATKHPTVTGEDGGAVPSVVSFWFAWQAFHPATGVWKPQ